MDEVFPQAFPHPADPAVVTVVYALVGVVVPELADVAVVTGGRFAALDAHFSRPLRIAAEHAEHVLRLSPRQDVVLGVVVAQAAGIPALAGEALQLDVAPVVLAPENAVGCEVVALDLVGADPSFVRIRHVGRPNVTLRQDELLRCGGLAEDALPELERVERSDQRRLFGRA